MFRGIAPAPQRDTQQSFAKATALFAPPPRLSLSEWADTYRVTSREASADVGKWVTRPYQREIFDAFTDPRVKVVVIMACVQLVKTEFILNALGYVIHLDPGPALVIQFRDTDAEIFSKRRFAPMLRDTPVLRGLVADSKSKSSGNTITDKTFPGGHIRMAASASPGNLAALPIRYLFCDEIDKYPVSAGPEGDPISVAEGRLTEFEGRSKEILTCSPTVSGSSRIEKAYLDSDQRELEVPCPECGAFQPLKWSQVAWDSALAGRKKQAESARYVCMHCDAKWDDAMRWRAVHGGKFAARQPFNGVAGFHLNALVNLKKRLSAFVAQFLKQKDDQEQLKVFVNTILAEPWAEKGETPEWQRLVEQREPYTPGTVPAGGLFLTAGVDVQRDRIEVEVVAWGRNRESWSVDYRIFDGNPGTPGVWKQVADLLQETFPHAHGPRLSISRMFVDSGDGQHTNDVYVWVRSQDANRVLAIKGDDRAMAPGVPLSQPSAVDVTESGRKVGLKIKRLAVSFFKRELYERLRLRPPTPDELKAGASYPTGYCHHPIGENYGDEHFRQVTNEQLMTRRQKNGRVKQEFVKLGRNEALDCRNYARGAAWDLGVEELQEGDWLALEARVAKPDQVAVPTSTPTQPRAQAQPQAANRPDGGWLPKRKWFT